MVTSITRISKTCYLFGWSASHVIQKRTKSGPTFHYTSSISNEFVRCPKFAATQGCFFDICKECITMYPILISCLFRCQKMKDSMRTLLQRHKQRHQQTVLMHSGKLFSIINQTDTSHGKP